MMRCKFSTKVPWNMFVSVFTVYHGDKGLLYPTMSFCHGAQHHDIPEIANADEYWLNPWAKINFSSFQYIFLGYLLTRLESWVIHRRLGQAHFFPLRQIRQISQSPYLLIIYCMWRKLCLHLSFNDTLEDRRYFSYSPVVFKSSVFPEFYAKSSH